MREDVEATGRRDDGDTSTMSPSTASSSASKGEQMAVPVPASLLETREGAVNPFIFRPSASFSGEQAIESDLAQTFDVFDEEEEGDEDEIPLRDDEERQEPQLPQKEDNHSTKTRKHKRDSKEEETVLKRLIRSIKYTYSGFLLVFSIAVVMSGIFTKQTIGTAERGLHPVLAFGVFWYLIVWLAMMEGGQGCMVGLRPIPSEQYAVSHPRTLKNTSLLYEGDNLERFIVGRQFLAVLLVFVSNMMSSAIDGASVFGMPEIANEIFLGSGVALMLTTIVLGQLTAQVNAANCMLDFVNNYFMLYFVTYLALVIEFSGILHFVYLVRLFFAKLTGQPIESNEAPRTLLQSAFFWSRVTLSVALLAFAFAVTLTALFSEKTTMFEGVPPYISVLLFFVLLSFAGLLEGMQIALFAVVNVPNDELQHHQIAQKNCQLAFSGRNLQAFLIGRQILVTICMFVVARISTLNYTDADDNVYGVTDSIQGFFNTGLLGALITTVAASLSWRIVASSFPLAFLSNPMVYLIIRLCLIFEGSGLCSAAWLLAGVHKRIVGYQPDEVYLSPMRKACPLPSGDEKTKVGMEP